MSLNYNYEKVPEQFTTNPYNDLQHPVTYYLIWMSMSGGYGSITKSNVDEVYRRIALIQKLDGPAVMFQDDGIYITRQDIVNHIGLWTNASTKTPAEFDKWFVKRMQEQVVGSSNEPSAHDLVQARYEKWAARQEAA